VFPHLRALEDPLQLEEERRLCYVGITRARRQLYLTHAWSRTLWGSTSHAIPSRFLSELPGDLVRDVGSSWTKRPDPLRALSWSRRGSGRHPGPGNDWEGIDPEVAGDADSQAHVPGGAGEWADDFHDPDPWGDADPVPTSRRAPSSPRPASGSAGGARTSSASAGGARTAGRKSRLPKMAEWRNGTSPRK
jgi:hypothetical protein